MTDLIYNEDDFIARWVWDRIPMQGQGFKNYRALGIARDGRLLAGVVFHDYLPAYGNLQISLAAEPGTRWMTRTALYAAFWYPFGELGCNRVTALIARKNKPARRLTEKVGWKLEGVVRQGFFPDDAMIYGMLRAECKWLRPPMKLAA